MTTATHNHRAKGKLKSKCNELEMQLSRRKSNESLIGLKHRGMGRQVSYKSMDTNSLTDLWPQEMNDKTLLNFVICQTNSVILNLESASDLLSF